MLINRLFLARKRYSGSISRFLSSHPAIALSESKKRPLDFTIQYPPGRKFFKQNYRSNVNLTEHHPASDFVRSNSGKFGLYLHIPFCESKCSYCNFSVVTKSSTEDQAAYVRALESSLGILREELGSGRYPSGIDIGGGTPTLLPVNLLSTVLNALAPFRSPKISDPNSFSIESTPKIGAESPERLAVLREYGVSRVSIGLQTTTDETLLDMNRFQPFSLAAKAFANLKDLNFPRLSADLIFGLPGQTSALWRQDLERTVDLPVDAITIYDCLYRGQGRVMSRKHKARPTPGEFGKLYDLAYSFLHSHGFQAPYGSSNFSRCRGESGTSTYFENRLISGETFFGIGCYSTTAVDPTWAFAPYSASDWVKCVQNLEGLHAALPLRDVYELPTSELAAKHLLFNLSFGVLDGTKFRNRFGASL